MQPRNRLFPAGSRQAPDPYDQFLEQRGFYRKHTARDASCLFRAVSEQLYDTQLYHEKVRADLVIFMNENRLDYENEINSNFDDYMTNLASPNTYGGLVELRALGHRNRRNVFLFGAFNTGIPYVEHKEYEDYIRVFFTPENHFDSIFLGEYIEDLAFTQSLCFELLYKTVFCLPDVMYAVERMLHDPVGETMKYVCTNAKKSGYSVPDLVLVEDGRQFFLDSPEKTSCILDNYELCHFHNKHFATFVQGLERETKQCENNVDLFRLNKTLESLLPDKDLSCVRQLMNEGITPFPYKVAKGLDPDIYRNVEFDAWSDLRKIKKFGRSDDFVVGQKCLVRLNDSNSNWYNCHIQEMSPDRGPCLVFIEELGEKKHVNYNQLKLNDRYKRWNTPMRHRKHFAYRKYISVNPYNYRRFREYGPRFIEDNYDYSKDIDECQDEKCMAFNQYNDFRHFTPPTRFEMIAMPLQKEDTFGGNTKKAADPNQPRKKFSDRNNNNPTGNSTPKEDTTATPKDHKFPGPVSHTNTQGERGTNSSVSFSEEHVVSENDQFFNGYGYFDQNLPFPYDPNIPPPAPYTGPYQQTVVNPNLQQSSMYYYSTNPMYTSASSSQTYGSSMMSSSCSGNLTSSIYVANSCMPYLIPIRRKDLLSSQYAVNYNLNHSFNPNGSDIPVGDLVSVRFFYNLGLEYFKFVHSQYGSYAVDYLTQPDIPSIQIDLPNSAGDIDVHNLSTEFHNNMQLDGSPAKSQHVQGNKNIPSPAAGKSVESQQHLIPSQPWKRNYTRGGNNYHGHTNRKDNKPSGAHRHQPQNKNNAHNKPTPKRDEAPVPVASQSVESNVTSEISQNSSERSDAVPQGDYYQQCQMMPLPPYTGYTQYVPYYSTDPIEQYPVYSQPYYAPPYTIPTMQPPNPIPANDSTVMIPCDNYNGLETPPLHYPAYPSYLYPQPYTTATPATVPRYWCYQQVPIVTSPMVQNVSQN